ncbi:hypothetical protein [Rhizobium rhizogenes]|uniref:hypothetical protein n=1 Tax=Rhizobium rhizogenes TaxID=359 RepID=UPI001571AAFF|nr:hypothetical protein [Rhizobium rhizogenes]NTF98076.1 hypothetical protein [Rhizobium rhizogenes]
MSFKPFSDIHRHLYGSIQHTDFLEWHRRNNFDLAAWSELYFARFPPIERNMRLGELITKDIYTLTHQKHRGWEDFHVKYQLLNAGSKFAREPRSVADAKEIIDEIAFFLARQKEYQRQAGILVTESRLHLAYRYGNEVNNYFIGRILEILRDLNEPEIRMTIAFSLARDNPHAIWDVLKSWLVRPIGQFCTGLDFCGNELLYQPEGLRYFFREILSFNRENPKCAVALLMHAGELVQEGSIESSIRRVHTAARLGTHRIGHATILGVASRSIKKHRRTETVSSRKIQIQYDLEEFEGLRRAGANLNRSALEKEMTSLESVDEESILVCADFSVNDLEARQKYVLDDLVSRGTVVECCPTSNVIIGDLESYADHPISEFLRRGVRVVLATDDEGLFATDLQREFALIKQVGLLTEQEIEQLEFNSRDCISEILSGRYKADPSSVNLPFDLR